MSLINEHEVNYRSAKAFKKMMRAKICVCGAGAIGSNLINNLVRQGVTQITVVDMDRVEVKNTATQIYTMRDIGQMKTAALKSLVHQSTKQIINTIDKELKANNASKLLKGFDLVVDAFDNWESRKLVKKACTKLNIPCVHAGMSDDGFSEIKWNENYSIPDAEVKQNDICDYPLAANLVHLTVAILSEVIVQQIVDGNRANREVTLKDMQVHKV